MSFLYFLYHWSLGNQSRCVYVLLLITKPSTTKSTYIDNDTVTLSSTRRTTFGILPCKATNFFFFFGGGGFCYGFVIVFFVHACARLPVCIRPRRCLPVSKLSLPRHDRKCWKVTNASIILFDTVSEQSVKLALDSWLKECNQRVRRGKDWTVISSVCGVRRLWPRIHQ